MNQIGPDDEVLPPVDPLRGADGSFADLAPPSNSWDLPGIGAAVVIGALPVFVELVYRGTMKDDTSALFNPSTIGYALFAIGASAAVQCAQNPVTRSWIFASFPPILMGIILGLNFSDPANDPDLMGWMLVGITGLLTAVAVFVAWRPKV